MNWMEAGGKRGSLQRGNRVDEDKAMEDNSLYSSRETVHEFRVSVRRTEASSRCRLKGDGVLRADMESLQLLDKTGDILYTWPYRYLRRFGRDKSTFSFEAGRRCDSGEGSFEFDTKQGNALFQSVEAAINLQKISLPHRQMSGGSQGVSDVTQNQQNHPVHSRAAQPQTRGQVPQTPAVQVLGDVYSLVTAPQNQQTFHNKDNDSSNPSQQQRPPLSRLEPPVDKILTGVKSLTLDTRGLPVPRKNQVKMISSCPLPNASPESGPSLTLGPSSTPTPNPRLSPKLSSNQNLEQAYSQINISGPKKEKKSSSNVAPCTPSLIIKEPDYSLPFDTIASNVMADIFNLQLADRDESGPDPLYDSIDEMKIRNIFRNNGDTKHRVDHIYDEPEGCAAAGQEATPPTVVYDDPEEMRGNAWKTMGTPSDPKGHEYPYNPRVDDYAVPKQPKRAFGTRQNTTEEVEQEQKQEEEESEKESEESEEEEEEEEEKFSPYNNVMVKMA